MPSGSSPTALSNTVDQGLVIALDLDGRLLWGHREKAGHDNRGSFHRSPLVCGDLVLVRSYTEATSTGKRVRAYDTRTGQLRWETPLAGSNYTLPRLMKLADQDLLIGDAPTKTEGQQILRVSDGQQLGALPKHNLGRGALMSVCGDVVTGKQVGQLPAGINPSCAVVAGRYLIGVNDEAGPYDRKREDHMALVRFSVVDIADLAQPKRVSDQNYLGYSEPPADIVVRTYFKEFDPYSFVGCCRGTAGYVTEHMSGPVPHGNKLLIQTSAFLYCIGEK